MKLVLAIGRHPSLWITAIRVAIRLVPNRWWSRRPFLPIPDREWARFRTETMYGDPEHELVPEDMLNYLRWCKDYRKAIR